MLDVAVLERLRAAVGDDGLITAPAALRTYACDGLTGHRVTPAAVALPLTTDAVAEVVRTCVDASIPFVARGAGTGLSGGALPVADGVVVCLSRMRSILDVDLDNHQVTVQPGVTNLEVSKAVAAARVLLRAGPVVAAGVHDRWQRRGELRRRALPEVRIHHAPRARCDVRHRRTDASRGSEALFETLRATTSSASSSAARARSAS